MTVKTILQLPSVLLGIVAIGVLAAVYAPSTTHRLMEAAEAGAQQPAPPAEDYEVAVVLDDIEIRMPDTLTAGAVIVQIQNEGTIEHSLAIEGNGIDEVLKTPLPPGGSTSIELELQIGEYVVSCPVADHEERGQSLVLTVIPAAPQNSTGG